MSKSLFDIWKEVMKAQLSVVDVYLQIYFIKYSPLFSFLDIQQEKNETRTL